MRLKAVVATHNGTEDDREEPGISEHPPSEGGREVSASNEPDSTANTSSFYHLDQHARNSVPAELNTLVYYPASWQDVRKRAIALMQRQVVLFKAFPTYEENVDAAKKCIASSLSEFDAEGRVAIDGMYFYMLFSESFIGSGHAQDMESVVSSIPLDLTSPIS